MLKKYSKFKSIILPNNKLNYFVFSIISIGFITGCIFLLLISESDKKIIISSLNNFINNINDNSLELLKNIGLINLCYIFLLIIFSLSIIGNVLNITIIYFKSFILGFTISSIFFTFGIKGIFLSIIYLIPSNIINLFVIYLLGIYSLMFSYKLIGQLFNKKNNYIKIFIKKYIFIIIICLLLTILSTAFETFIFPLLLKLLKNIIKF